MAKIIKSAKGSFTAASITVDGSGRVVTASSGAGAANMKYHYFKSGSASGNITAGANVSKTQAFLWSGGGGGGGGDSNPSEKGGNGGSGSFGYYEASVSGPATLSFSVGAGGNGGPNANNAGNAGGATTFHNFTVNGGNGGNGFTPGGNNGSGGSAPGAVSIPASSSILFANADGFSAGGNGGGATGPSGNRVGGNGGPGALVVLLNDG